MTAILGRSKLCSNIASVLGIKHCRWLNINMHVDDVVIVKAEFYPEIDGVVQVESIFQEYELVKKEQE